MEMTGAICSEVGSCEGSCASICDYYPKGDYLRVFDCMACKTKQGDFLYSLEERICKGADVAYGGNEMSFRSWI